MIDLSPVAGLAALVHLYVWGGIAWMMFCRAIRLGPDTRHIIHLSISGVGTLAIASAIAPLVPGWQYAVRPLDLLIGGALFALFAGFERSWRNGPPEGVAREKSAAPRCTKPPL